MKRWINFLTGAGNTLLVLLVSKYLCLDLFMAWSGLVMLFFTALVGITVITGKTQRFRFEFEL